VSYHDVAVIGAGPAGAATALTLAKKGWRVLLIDASPNRTFRVGEGLPPPARSLLRDLGVLERFLADGHRTSYGNLSAWGSATLQATDFLLQVQGHGFQLDRVRFDVMLRTATCETGVELREETLLTTVEQRSGGAFRLHLSDRKGTFQTDCRWLVDASGRRSRIARVLNSTRLAADRLTAFYTILQTSADSDKDGRTWIEACPDGWWYSVLLPTGGRLVAYLTDLDLADKRKLLSIPGFHRQLAQTEHLSALSAEHGYSVCQRPRGSDASSGRLDRCAGANWLAVGDAALSFDPLSSQGITNALYTGLQAGQTIAACLNGNDETVKERYANHLAAIYRAYMQNRTTFYAYETRWPTRPFWQRRVEIKKADNRNNESVPPF
jgi:2-polyprenyl-6-methoxyphenol hydroxylase-like FAD-dependent oxidoreductase